jgi:Flp pilus assembly protein CpaB
MQPDFVAERRRRRLVLTFGLVLGLAAAAATYFLITRPPSGTPTATPAARTIVVAAVDIKSRTQILPVMLRTQSVPDSPVFDGTASEIDAVVGKIALVDIDAGQALQASLFGEGNAAGVSILTPGETVGPDSPIWRAVSITVPTERAVGGLVAAGDHVDLIVTLTPQLYDPSGGLVGANDPGHPALFNQLYADATTKVTLTNVEILTVDKEGGVYVIKVDQRQAEQIAHIQSSGGNSFTMTLRPQADTRSFDPAQYGQTTNQLFTDFGFRIPQQINITASASPGTVPTPSAAPTVAPGPSPSPTP